LKISEHVTETQIYICVCVRARARARACLKPACIHVFFSEFYICLYLHFRFLLWNTHILGLMKRSSILVMQVEVMISVKMILMRLGSAFQSFRKRVRSLVALSIPGPWIFLAKKKNRWSVQDQIYVCWF